MVRSDEELRLLFTKFDRDVKVYSRWYRFILVVDQGLNVVWLNGSQDETCSSHISRKIDAGTATKFQMFVCKVLRKLESKHCIKSRGE